MSMWLRLDHIHKYTKIKRNSSTESIGKSEDIILSQFYFNIIVFLFFLGQSLHKESHSLDDLSHIFSVGYDAMLIEFWLDPLIDGLVVRLTRPNENKFDLLSEVNFNNCLSSIAWHHIAINVNGIRKKEKIIEVSYSLL